MYKQFFLMKQHCFCINLLSQGCFTDHFISVSFYISYMKSSFIHLLHLCTCSFHKLNPNKAEFSEGGFFWWEKQFNTRPPPGLQPLWKTNFWKSRRGSILRAF